MAAPYDVIVVGARCAGSPTAMLLAQKGYRVLVVDRATFPSDTVSTHFIHPPGVASLQRWGLLDAVRASGCPPVTTYSFDFGPFRLSGSPQPIDGVAQGYAPRRTVLDKILVDAAASAGAEVREQFIVQEVVTDDDGRVTGIQGRDADGAHVTEEATVVIGADGRYSSLAKAVEPEQYNERPSLEGNYYTYWSNLPVDGFDAVIRPQHGWAAFPTNDDLTLVVAGVADASLRRLPPQRRADLSLDVRLRAGVRRAHPWREARSAVRGDRRPAELLPQAVWLGLGTRGRRGLSQGPAHRVRHHRRVPRRRAPRRRARSVVQGGPVVRRRDAATISSSATKRRWRCSSSPASWRRWSRPHPRCSNCSAR